ncbi:MAG: amino acid ABC transporter substrate-binding protein [Rhodospirillaceae bacterium]|nr:amino acid ABC transporter substrate-binding protein [Rhodospirillaceae bacterium]MBT5307876.1 amino acid ABC transporter substrate-binding protein [Rhodospirillaceae bacterium]MBT7355993.1 amino acid ABC transporter substrate-binding protein [Rhodospirillaceae bacterium]
MTGAAACAVASVIAASGAVAAGNPLLIGLTSDASGQYANSGASDRRGMMMAIEEFNSKGGVLGRQIKTIHIDTETTPATGSRVAERMITRDKVGFMIGAVSSGVANAISQVAQKYGVVYLNTNSSSPTESGKNCHRVKFVWDGNGKNFAQAAVKNAVSKYGKKWVLMTNDYVWGHNTSKATRSLAEGAGAKIAEEIMIPQGTRDFSSSLLKIQQLNPKVVAAAVGGDDQKAMRTQISQLDMGTKYAWINNQQDWPDVYGLPTKNLFGVFGTTWYYKFDLPGVKEFNAKYQKMYPHTKMKVPGNVFYNGYWATRSLMEAIEKAGTTENHAVIKQLEQLRIPAAVRMQHDDAFMNPKTHQMQQTVYLARANLSSKDKNDMFEIVAHASPATVKDGSADTTCKLESFADTPKYTP